MKHHRSELLAELKKEFPVLREEINQEMGLLHFEVGVFRRFTQQKITEGDEATVRKCFFIAEKYYSFGNAKVHDAIAVSYVEELEFKDSRQNQKSWAWECLPQILKDEYISFHGRPGA